MSPGEVAHRVVRAVQARAEKAGLLSLKTIPEWNLAVPSQRWVHVTARVAPERYLAAADRIAEGWLDVFALKNLDLGSPPRWNRDPKTGIEAPLVFGKLLDYRDPDVVGDIKYLWEPNRHLHLVTLAQAFALTGHRRYLDAIAEQLQSWFIACPYALGPNWSSSLEPAIRLVNWSLAWQLLGGAHSEAFEKHPTLRENWLKSIYQHAEFIRGWLSLHSSANNHLVGEAAGLFVAGLTWPHWPRSQSWAATGKRILEREILLQNAPDGVNREQAIAYQQFELDLLLLCMLAGKANGQWFSPAYESRLEAMLDFIASIMDAGGNVPMFGDSDDGYVVRLSQEANFCPYRSLLATGAVLFRRGDFKRQARGMDDKSRWLLGATADAKFDALDAQKSALPARQQFPDGGYYILGADLGGEDEIRVVADAGPLGYRSIAAHGHADALSFTLSVGGRELLIDPGTYAYHTHGRWRQYFRGTAAHNTVRVDGLDQSEPGGNFMWIRHARAGCSLWLSSAAKDTFEGWHTGYLRLEDPVKHRRLIELDKRARHLVVEDTLEMAEEHDVELFFHCSEHCRVDEVPGGYVIARDGASAKLTLPEGGKSELLCASVAPIAGWVSRSFDTRQPAPTLVWRSRLAGRAVLRCEIAISATGLREPR
jgi:Heparinase II/III-like protein/Heparinase II/III N-terminus